MGGWLAQCADLQMSPFLSMNPMDGSVMLRGFFRVAFCLYMMTVGQMRVMSGLFVLACFVVVRGNPVVFRCLLVVFRCLTMMFGDLVCHK
jgi:hypothetical protein